MGHGYRIFADLHTHTRHSHGCGTVADNLRAARAAGLRYVGIAEHGPGLLRVGIRGWDVLDRIRAEARACGCPVGWPEAAAGGRGAARAGVAGTDAPGAARAAPAAVAGARPCGEAGEHAPRALVGVEANVVALDGTIDVPADRLGELDVLLVGLHRLAVPRSLRDARLLFLPSLLPVRPGSRRARSRARNTEALIAAVERYPVDAVTHPGSGAEVDLRALARACARVGTALEINLAHGGLDEAEIRLAAAEGCSFVIASDAHRPEHVGRFGAAVERVLRAGVEPRAVLNLEREGEGRDLQLRLRAWRQGRPAPLRG